jgi:hypothetical protein
VIMSKTDIRGTNKSLQDLHRCWLHCLREIAISAPRRHPRAAAAGRAHRQTLDSSAPPRQTSLHCWHGVSWFAPCAGKGPGRGTPESRVPGRYGFLPFFAQAGCWLTLSLVLAARWQRRGSNLEPGRRGALFFCGAFDICSSSSSSKQAASRAQLAAYGIQIPRCPLLMTRFVCLSSGSAVRHRLQTILGSGA